MHIEGTAYRAEFGAGQDPVVDPLTWTVPATVDLTIEYDTGTPIGTATLTQDEFGTITADVPDIANQYRRWMHNRPYLGLSVVDGTVECVGALTASLNLDPDIPQWTEISE